jgi:GT2 family glycosyltransferase
VTTAIAIVNWNSGNYLRTSIESVLATSNVSEIVVVDNASTDGSAADAESFGDRVQLIRNASNRGFAGGINQAFTATRAGMVLALNPDAQATPDAIIELERLMSALPRAAAIGGDVNERYPPRDLPGWTSIVRQNLGITARAPERHSGEAQIVGQPAAAAMMIRREAFDDVGGFDESFFPAWYEDVDFCFRLRSAGWEIYFAPRARFIHAGGYSAKALGPKAFAAAFYRNQLRYAQKHFGRGATAAVRTSMVIGMTARMLVQPRAAGACSEVISGALGGW